MEFLEDSKPAQEVAAEEAPYFGAGKNPTEVEELIAPYEENHSCSDRKTFVRPTPLGGLFQMVTQDMGFQ